MKKFLMYLCLMILFCNQIVFASNSDGNIKIKKDTRHLHSRLSKDYTGYVYKIQNTSSKPVAIIGISVDNDLTGKAASKSVQRSSVGIGAKTVGTGLVFALPTLTLSLIGSVIIAPFQMLGNSVGNIGAKQEGNRYSKSVEGIVLNSGDRVELKTIAVRRSAPTVKVFYKIPGTEEVKTLEYK